MSQYRLYGIIALLNVRTRIHGGELLEMRLKTIKAPLCPKCHKPLRTATLKTNMPLDKKKLNQSGIIACMKCGYIQHKYFIIEFPNKFRFFKRRIQADFTCINPVFFK